MSAQLRCADCTDPIEGSTCVEEDRPLCPSCAVEACGTCYIEARDRVTVPYSFPTRVGLLRDPFLAGPAPVSPFDEGVDRESVSYRQRPDVVAGRAAARLRELASGGAA